jgi:hypothetical protein
VDVVLRRQARADVDELADPGPGQRGDGLAEEDAVGAGDLAGTSSKPPTRPPLSSWIPEVILRAAEGVAIGQR